MMRMAKTHLFNPSMAKQTAHIRTFELLRVKTQGKIVLETKGKLGKKEASGFATRSEVERCFLGMLAEMSAVSRRYLSEGISWKSLSRPKVLLSE